MEWWETFFDAEMAEILFSRRKWEQAEENCEKIIEILKLQPSDRILDLACGTGRYSIALARRGFNVTGLDYSNVYIEKAKEKAEKEGVSVEFIQGDMRNLPYEDEFDCVLCLYTSFGYFEREEDHRRVIEGVHRALKRGGKLLLDQVSYEYLLRHFQETDWTELDNGFLLQRRKLLLDESKLEAEWILTRDDKTRRYNLKHRLFTTFELKKLLEDEGFTVLDIFGNYNFEPKALDSRRTIIIAEK